MGLRTYVLKRIFFSFVILYFVVTVNFVIFMLMPGDPVTMLASKMKLKKPEMIEAVTQAFGLDQPLHVRYGKYVMNMLTGQFGYSYVTRRPVVREIGMRLQNTLVLCIPPEIFSVIIGSVLGVIAAAKRGKLIDSASVVTSIIGWSLPVYWMAMQFILVFAYRLGWFPPGHSVPMHWEYLPPQTIWEELGTRLWYLVLPWTVLFLWSYGGYLLLARAQILECITEDYVLTARAKGLKERTVLFKHTLKNALLPIVTEAAIYFGFMLGGAIITEQVFKYPGLGWWIWQSIGSRDYPALQAIFFIIAVCVIIANFVADLLYGVIDPRVKYG